ncbi:MAG TPA: hypothetical protein VKZ59_05035, partial [Acidobacteriota bacterium]|nr:hypothetical protein [Acidobacteriota bacterium]
RDRMAESVNLGVEFAREWCRREGVELKSPGGSAPVEVHDAQTRLRFTEEMKGYLSAGKEDFRKAYLQGERENNFFKFHLTITINGVNRFVTNPRHEASAEGWLEGDLIGGRRPVQRGVFNLLSYEEDPNQRQMIYRLYFEDAKGEPLTLWGRKEVYDDPGIDLWSDTTELFVRILKGHVEAGKEPQAEILYSGMLRIYLQDFLKQLTTFRVDGPTTHDRVAALNRFGRFFFRKLWDVYARHFVEYGPW